MSGETEKEPSGLSTDNLKMHYDKVLEEMDRRYEQRFIAQESASRAAMTAAQEAVHKAEVAAEKRFDSVNEFRATLADQASTLMPRAESTLRWEAVSERVTKIENLLAADVGKSQGLNAAWGYLVGAIALAATVVSIIIATR